MTKLLSRALTALGRTASSSALKAKFRDGYLCARTGGYDAYGEVEVEIANDSKSELRLDEMARLELFSSAGRRLARVTSEARELDGDVEKEFDGRLAAGRRTTLRCQLVVGDLMPGDEVSLRGRLDSDGGRILFESPVLRVGNVLPAG